MLIFRIICAVLMAWSVNIVLARPEAAVVLQTLPEMTWAAPLAAAAVGYFNLAVRQGWGFIVAIANGIWAGVLSVFLSGVLFVAVEVFKAFQTNVVRSFDNFLVVFGEIVQPLLDALVDNIPLLVVSFGASALVGFATEVLHWVLVRMRQRKGGQASKST